jgi:hypothetical protein
MESCIPMYLHIKLFKCMDPLHILSTGRDECPVMAGVVGVKMGMVAIEVLQSCTF